MKTDPLPEYWLRGPLPGIPALLQPVAHALLQAQEEIHALLQEFPGTLLWERPGGMASAGFHLQHIAGVLDRLYTYARGEALTPQQLAYLAEEGKTTDGNSVGKLLDVLDVQLTASLQQLAGTDPQTLTQARAVGRLQFPSTVLGLLFHSAEHTMRHTGQLLVTVNVVKR